MKHMLTLDLGTTSVKTCIFTADFRLAGYSSEEYRLLTSAPGIVELEPETYWKASVKGIKEVLCSSGINPKEITAISVTTQGETLIPVDASGKPLYNAIVWLDSRAVEEAADICQAFPAEIVYRTTGMSELGPACPVNKLLWLKKNVPDIFGESYKFLLLLDFIVLRLTGQYISDRCIMSSTGYFDINSGELWNEMLDFIGVEPEKIPALCDCGTNIGSLTKETVDELGLCPGVIVSTGGMDQAASAVGAGNISVGIVTETTGTALVVAATTETPDFNNAAMVNIIRHAVKGSFLVLPYNQIAGMALKWFKDEFCINEAVQYVQDGRTAYACLDEMAETVSPLACGLMFMPHMAGILIPEVNSSVKGMFFGVGLDTGKPCFVRAILEGVAYMLREDIELLEEMGMTVKEIRSLGGGARSPLWCRIKADVNNRPIHIMEQNESTSLGAAILCSLAAGIYGSLEAACRVVKIKQTCMPDAHNTAVYEQGFAKYKKLYSRVKDLF